METNEPRVIELKCLPVYYAAIETGEKTFEIREDDRGYKVGDILHLREYNREDYTGRWLRRVVTYITEFQQQRGYVVMGIANPAPIVPPVSECCGEKAAGRYCAKCGYECRLTDVLRFTPEELLHAARNTPLPDHDGQRSAIVALVAALEP